MESKPELMHSSSTGSASVQLPTVCNVIDWLIILSETEEVSMTGFIEHIAWRGEETFLL